MGCLFTLDTWGCTRFDKPTVPPARFPRSSSVVERVFDSGKFLSPAVAKDNRESLHGFTSNRNMPQEAVSRRGRDSDRTLLHLGKGRQKHAERGEISLFPTSPASEPHNDVTPHEVHVYHGAHLPNPVSRVKTLTGELWNGWEGNFCPARDGECCIGLAPHPLMPET